MRIKHLIIWVKLLEWCEAHGLYKCWLLQTLHFSEEERDGLQRERIVLSQSFLIRIVTIPTLRIESSLFQGCCSVAQLCLTLCDPMGASTPGFPVLYHLLEFVQTQVH